MCIRIYSHRFVRWSLLALILATGFMVSTPLYAQSQPGDEARWQPSAQRLLANGKAHETFGWFTGSRHEGFVIVQGQNIQVGIAVDLPVIHQEEKLSLDKIRIVYMEIHQRAATFGTTHQPVFPAPGGS